MGSKTPVSTVVICVTIMFVFSLATVAALAIAVPEGAILGSLITVLMGSLAPTIAAITILVKQDKNAANVKDNALIVHDTNAKVTKVLNGAMEEKIARVVRQVMSEKAVVVDSAAMALLKNRTEN